MEAGGTSMYELSVDTHFSAAHNLRDYKGDCARMHGHNWGVTVTVGAQSLDDTGMSKDFKEISAALEDIVKKFDHQTLNLLDEFINLNPTAENVARIIYESLSEKLKDADVISVTVSESERYRVTYKKRSC